MDAGFCAAARDEELARFGKPEIFKTNQGSQFTSQASTSVLRAAEVRSRTSGPVDRECLHQAPLMILEVRMRLPPRIRDRAELRAGLGR